MHRRFLFSRSLVASCMLALCACGENDPGVVDGGSDAGVPPVDGSVDGGPEADGGSDGGVVDGGSDAGPGCEALEPGAVAAPATGEWAAGFGHPGVGGTRPSVGTFAFGPDGTVYVGGSFSSAGYDPASNVASWSVTAGWSALGAGVPEWVSKLVLGADGTLYAAHGHPDSTTDYRISRWDGTTWSTFVDANGAITDLAFVGDRLLVVGDFTTIGGVSLTRVALHDGTTWTGYAGLAPDLSVQTISATGPSDVCLGGRFTTLGVVEANHVGCWNGTAWQARSIPAGVNTGVADLERDPADGSLVAGGSFTVDDATGGGIARWTGTAWELIGDGVVEFSLSGSAGSVAAIAFAPSGMYVGGRFRQANASLDPMTEVNDAARWDGTVWQAMGTGLSTEGGIGIGARPGAVGAVATAPDGSVFFGGGLNRAGTMLVGGAVRWDGTYWRGLRGSGESYHGVSGDVRAFARHGTCGIYVGGQFEYAGEVRANGIARFSRATGYEALGEGLVGAVETIEVTQAGLVYAAGNFTDPSGIAFRNLGVWDGTEWSAVGGSVGDPTDLSQSVRALAIGEGLGVDGADVVYVAGSITRAGGERVRGLAMWDGAAWTDLGVELEGHEILSIPGSYADPIVSALLVDAETGDLIIAGSFGAVGLDAARVATNNVARWDGTAWHAYGAGAGTSESVVTSATFLEGRLVVARTFANDDPLLYAVWDGSAWQPLGTGQPGFTVPVSIDAVGDTLFVAGNASLDHHAAVWDGTAWSTLGEGTSDSTTAVLAIEGGALYGGMFNRAGDIGAGSIAFWQYAE